VLNALNKETLQEIKNALADTERDKTVRVVIITGSGPRAFCAGADVAELIKLTPTEVSDLVELGREVFDLIENIDKPVIAAVNGLALGGGFELATSCDIIIASDKARFGQPEVNLGVMPGWGGTQKLTRLIGTKKAKEIIILGGIISANEALNLRVVNKVVPEEKLMEEAVTLAKDIASKSPIALGLIKKAINAALETPLSKGIIYERSLYMLLFNSEDAKEGISAFLEKRKPIWKGK
jgi:enoyl-CoA hydratase